MRRLIIFILTSTMTLALHATDYREMYKGNVYNFITRDKDEKPDEFMVRNAEKILEHVNKGREERDKFFIVQYAFGSFAGTGGTEVLVCFNMENFRKTFFAIREIRLYVFDENECISNEYEMESYFITILSRQDLYECPALGKLYTQGWICDLNGNGKQELIFKFGYLNFVSIRIMEFDGEAFRDLLEFMEMNTKVLDADVESGTLYLERRVANMEKRQFEKVRTKAVWNADAGMYEESELETGRNINEFDSGIR